MFFVIIIKGLGKVVDLVFDYLEKYLYNFLYYKYYKKNMNEESRYFVFQNIYEKIKYL